MLKRTLTDWAAILLLASWSANALGQTSVPIEPGANIRDSDNWTRAKMLEIAEPLVTLIRLNGWRCDSISALRPFSFSHGYTVKCNRFAYHYEVFDRGGRWIVEVK